MLIALLFLYSLSFPLQAQVRQVVDFNAGWSFLLDSVSDYQDSQVDYQAWRQLNLPHDWSIEMPFDSLSAGSTGTGYLSGGVGWYKKAFSLSSEEQSKRVLVEFEGIYQNSEVWINDTYLGFRPNGYLPIVYDLTPYIHKNGQANVITVKVDNSKQPNSRFYAGSGIYRNVKLFFKEHIAVAQESTFITTPYIEPTKAQVNVQFEIENHGSQTQQSVLAETRIYDAEGKVVATSEVQTVNLEKQGHTLVTQMLELSNPALWSPEHPTLYRTVTSLRQGTQVLDDCETTFGIRSFAFDVENGFSLNGVPTKIRGVCMHSDLGALGMAFNRSAAKRQLQLMKDMGVNSIRTSHNPAAPEFLDLCDEMGFIVMSETFDVWKYPKNPYDYHLYWDDWYERDFVTHIKRDRNHPSVLMWCLGNEAQEQWHGPESGKAIPQRLAAIADSLDGTRPTTIGNNEMSKNNPVLMSPAVDIIGYNYNHLHWASALDDHPGRPFIVTESTSALASRGQYDLLSMDSIRAWPVRWDIPFDGGNKDKSISAYDHVRTPWGTTHEESLRIFESYPHISGMYVWTGFDYLGEPTPYTWPARSSYFGIVDLAGFPKDVYYLYQSVWTETPVLHILPHWNWQQGDVVDVVVYYNQADEIELLVNGISHGRRAKADGKLHVKWEVPYEAGTITAVAYQEGVEMRRAERKTAGKPVQLMIKKSEAEQHIIDDELAFLEVVALDADGNEVPLFNEWIDVTCHGGGTVIATDNGNPTDLMSFQSLKRKAYNGKLLVVVQGDQSENEIAISVHAEGVQSDEIKLLKIK